MDVQEAEFLRETNPVDAVEEVANGCNWSFDRQCEDELAVLAHGIWTNYTISFSWMADFEALHVVSAFDMRVPKKRLAETIRLLSLINEQMLFGHFDLWEQDGSVMFRHAMPLSGGAEPTPQQVECLRDAALTSCERYYQAFQYVVWAGKDARSALDGVLFDTVGEA